MGRTANRKKHQLKEVNTIDFPNDFVRIGRRVLNCPKFCELTPHARMLLFDLVAQLNGFNNGDLSASFKLMKLRGWRSPVTLGRAIEDLLRIGFIARTRYGSRNRCALYGVTFASLMMERKKLDPDLVAAFPGDRKRFKEPYLDPNYRPEAQLKSPAVRCHKENRRYTACISVVSTDTQRVLAAGRQNPANARGVSVAGGRSAVTNTAHVHLSSKPSGVGNLARDRVPNLADATAEPVRAHLRRNADSSDAMQCIGAE